MATGIFIGLSEDELLAIKAKAIKSITDGVITTSFSDSGTSIGKQVAMQPKEMLDESMFALSLLDPLTYGNPPKTVIRPTWRNGRDIF